MATYKCIIRKYGIVDSVKTGKEKVLESFASELTYLAPTWTEHYKTKTVMFFGNSKSKYTAEYHIPKNQTTKKGGK